MNIYLDIETIPSQRPDALERAAAGIKAPANYKDPDKIAGYIADHVDEAWRKTALDGTWGEIAVICMAVDNGPVQTFRLDQVIDEGQVLSDAWGAIRKAMGNNPTAPVFCGHNTVFDLKFLHHRSIVHSIRQPCHLAHNAAPWQGRYVDTMYEWVGARGGIKLTDLCAALGIEVDDEIDGSQVWDAWSAGEYDKVVEHCIADVERVRQIDRRLRWA